MAELPSPTLTKPYPRPDPNRGGRRAALYLVLECASPLSPSTRCDLTGLDRVDLGRGRPRTFERHEAEKRLAVQVTDPLMSSAHARLHKLLDRWVFEDVGSRNGSYINGVQQKRAALSSGDVVELGQTFFLFVESEAEPERSHPVLEEGQLRAPSPELTTFVSPLERQLEPLPSVARSAVSVVIEGESGTGKEVVARAIHQLSGRAGQMVAVNCGAITPTLVESELFGHKKGAFSGATEDRLGLVRSADGGTLLLDEIGELPLPAQATLLRVLQEREVLPVGATKPVQVDFRLISATHRDLQQLAEERRFRQDLLARIAGFTVKLPALRDRKEDLGLLIGRLLERVAGEAAAKVTMTAEAGRALLLHPWPLNIRELEKCLQTAVVLAGDGPVDVDHLPEQVRDGAVASFEGSSASAEPLIEVRSKEDLVALLEKHAGNVSAVARAVGKARMQVHRWVKQYGLDLQSFRRPV